MLTSEDPYTTVDGLIIGYEPEYKMVSRLLGLFKRGDEDPDCHEVRGVSSDYIDVELDQASQERIAKHLEWCGPCKAFLSTLRTTVSMLRSMPKREASDSFRERVREAVEHEGDD